MICCLNPKCQKPLNPEGAQICANCGSPLKTLRGRYRAVQPIGQGGFGKTYLAVDEDRLNTRCVVKQFSPQIQGTKSLEKAIQLFNQEAVRLDELGEHPQIPTLLAYFEQDSYLYLVQQFIEGYSLLQEMKQQGPFNERQLRDVLSDILPVLRFVHNHQVIHRDITPNNILRRQPDGRLILIDFGVAKQLNDAPGDVAGTRIGTEGYAPLEQFRGGRAFPGSDLYSLGATCLHLLTGTRPDTLYDPLKGCWLWREHLQKKGIVVSDQLANILDLMLKDLVGDRYQSADEVMRDLNADYFIPNTRPGGGGSRPMSSRVASAPSGGGAASVAKVSNPPTPVAPSKPPTSKPPASKPPASKPPTSTPPPSKPPLSTRASFPSATGWRCIHVLTGHSSWVTSVVLNATATAAASSSLDDTVKIWNLPKGELLFNLTGHSRDVNTLALSPDGKILFSGSDDCTVRVWHLPNGAPLRTLTGHARDVNALAVSADGRILISGGEDRTIRLWQVANGTSLKTLPGVLSMIKAIAAAPDGKTFASGGMDNKIRLWSLQTGEQLKTLSGHLSAVNAVVYSPDSSLIASGSRDKTIKVWNSATGELIRSFSDHTRDVNTLAFMPDGKTLVSGSADTSIKFWSLATGNVLDTLTGHADSVNAIALSANGRVLVSGSCDNTVRVWQV